MTSVAQRRIRDALLAGVYIVALGGRFTLDRVGISVFGELDLRVVGTVVVGIATLAWWLDPDRPERRAFRFGPGTGWLLALLVWLGLSGLWAPAGARVDEIAVGLGVLAVLVLATLVLLGPDPIGGAQTLLVITYAIGVFYALVGVVVGSTDVQGRLVVFGGGPNVLARVVGLGILAALVLMVLRRSWWYLAGIPFMVLAMAETGSRGAVAAGAGTILFFLAVRGRWIRVRNALYLIVPAVAASVLAFSLRGSEVETLIRQRIAETLAGDDSGRSDLLRQGWAQFTARPWFGGGLDGYYARYGVNVNIDYPHNVLLEIAASGGIVALLLTLGFVVSMVRGLWPLTRLPLARLAVVLMAIYVFGASMFSGDFYDSRFFWMFAVASAVGYLRGGDTDDGAGPAREPRLRRSLPAPRATPPPTPVPALAGHLRTR